MCFRQWVIFLGCKDIRHSEHRCGRNPVDQAVEKCDSRFRHENCISDPKPIYREGRCVDWDGKWAPPERNFGMTGTTNGTWIVCEMDWARARVWEQNRSMNDRRFSGVKTTPFIPVAFRTKATTGTGNTLAGFRTDSKLHYDNEAWKNARSSWSAQFHPNSAYAIPITNKGRKRSVGDSADSSLQDCEVGSTRAGIRDGSGRSKEDPLVIDD